MTTSAKVRRNAAPTGTLHVRLPPNLIDRLADYAEARSMSRRVVVEEALEAYLSAPYAAPPVTYIA